MKELTIEDLKIVKEFEHVPDEQLQWLISQGETLAEVKANILDALEGCLAVREEMALQESHAIEELEV